MLKLLSLVVLVGLAAVRQVDSHGRLLNPPARSSCWREFPGKCSTEYTDNQMNCGGFWQQHSVNGGKCSVCGEDWSLRNKMFERPAGSKYTGFKVRNYQQGQTVDVTVEITANHLGWFEFRVCNVDDRTGDADQSCLDKNLLADRNGVTRFQIGSRLGMFTYQLVLPKSLRCNHCVFQWKYQAGNNWGEGAQEQFYGCADVSIGGSSSGNNQITGSSSNNNGNTGSNNNSNGQNTSNNQNTGSFKCPGDGLFANKATNCTSFFSCLNTNTPSAQKVELKCPSGLLFNSNIQTCDWPSQVTC